MEAESQASPSLQAASSAQRYWKERAMPLPPFLRYSGLASSIPVTIKSPRWHSGQPLNPGETRIVGVLNVPSAISG